ncbi:MAG: hypothetical protein OEU32_00305 [Acidimicrobiia bacterium]|nr:hypothetical protein [Acidimicrobiia bacterium]
MNELLKKIIGATAVLVAPVPAAIIWFVSEPAASEPPPLCEASAIVHDVTGEDVVPLAGADIWLEDARGRKLDSKITDAGGGVTFASDCSATRLWFAAKPAGYVFVGSRSHQLGPAAAAAAFAVERPAEQDESATGLSAGESADDSSASSSTDDGFVLDTTIDFGSDPEGGQPARVVDKDDGGAGGSTSPRDDDRPGPIAADDAPTVGLPLPEITIDTPTGEPDGVGNDPDAGSDDGPSAPLDEIPADEAPSVGLPLPEIDPLTDDGDGSGPDQGSDPYGPYRPNGEPELPGQDEMPDEQIDEDVFGELGGTPGDDPDPVDEVPTDELPFGG